MEAITKTFNSKDIEVKEGSREVVAVISTDTIDRDNEVVLPKGMKKNAYQGSPLVLKNHDASELPIGKWLWIKADGGELKGKAYFANGDEDADKVLNLIKEGILSTFSISFIPSDASPPTAKELKDHPEWGDVKRVIRSYELLEASVVTIPSNRNTRVLAVAKGLSPRLKTFLGAEWEQPTERETKDYWSWTPEAKAIQVPTREIARVVEPAALPSPTYCRSWKSVKQQIDRLTSGARSADELYRHLKGEI